MTAYNATVTQTNQLGAATRRRPTQSDQWLKRGLDLALVVLAAAVFLPLVGLAALAIQLVDRGPVFYAQERRGLGGRRIRVWKLRTMYCDSAARLERHLAANPAAREEWNRFFKLRHDPRALPWIGGLLRRSSIDELPQIWNLLVGEMTLVGPRPLPDYHLAAFDGAFRHQRQAVVPGLTGLWQVGARSDGDAAVMRRLDGFYIANQSTALDLHILLRTIAVVLTGRGAR
jgi:lipopolysaccharide/colanic/teichoic acid biosynthesis glycosyltransferase